MYPSSTLADRELVPVATVAVIRMVAESADELKDLLFLMHEPQHGMCLAGYAHTITYET